MAGGPFGHHPHMSTPPFDDADEADRADQLRSVVDDDDIPTPPEVSFGEADEADALEQGTEVGEDEDYEDPR
jgi:hypothetical protein